MRGHDDGAHGKTDGRKEQFDERLGRPQPLRRSRRMQRRVRATRCTLRVGPERLVEPITVCAARETSFWAKGAQ